jgi:hypothetical protein
MFKFSFLNFFQSTRIIPLSQRMPETVICHHKSTTHQKEEEFQ